MQLNPHLNFNGECAEAFGFYERLLGGRIEYRMTWGESPMADKVDKEMHDKVIHLTFVLGGTTLTAGDAPPGRFEKPQGFSITLDLDDPEEAQRIYDAFAKEGRVQMPLEQTFWAERFGMVVDRFGTPWMINCRRASLEKAA
jgi:PhnB protein